MILTILKSLLSLIKKKLSVYDFNNLKGIRQISEVFVNNEEEAIAAEEAGIDIITAAYGMPQFGFNATLDDMVRIRKSCPNTHLMSAPPIFSYASSYEAIKSSYSLLSIGIDSAVHKKYLAFIGIIFSSPVIRATFELSIFLIILS